VKKTFKLNSTTDLQILKSQFKYDLKLNEEKILNDYYYTRQNFVDMAKSAAGRYAQKIGIYFLLRRLSSRLKQREKNKE
jgi:hypothetical protein